MSLLVIVKLIMLIVLSFNKGYKMEQKARKNWYKIALNKNLGFYTCGQYGGNVLYKVIGLVTRDTKYEGYSRYKAIKTIEQYI